MKYLKKTTLLTAIFAFFLTFSFSSAFAQIQQTEQFKNQPQTYTITGKIIDGQSKQAIKDAKVILINTGATTKTNKKGAFTFDNLKTGIYTIVVQADGYKAWKQQVELKADKDLTVKLKPKSE